MDTVLSNQKGGEKMRNPLVEAALCFTVGIATFAILILGFLVEPVLALVRPTPPQ